MRFPTRTCVVVGILFAAPVQAQLVVSAVKGDPAHGEDSDLYQTMGYVRKSARKTGLTRKTTTATAAAKKKTES